jgi:hypothetical protein
MLLYNTERRYDYGIAVNYRSKKFYNIGPWWQKVAADFYLFRISKKKSQKKKISKKKISKEKKLKKKILTVFGIVPVSYLSKFLKAWGHCYKTFLSVIYGFYQ